MICIYHNRDFDGFCSAAIVKLEHPNATFIGWDYGQPYPELPENESVIMVDISFEMKEMLVVAKHSKWNLTWIDHHISAIKDYEKFIGEGESFCKAILDSSISACEATWKYFFKDKPLPAIVELLGVYDTWRKDDKAIWEQGALPLQTGLRQICNGLNNFPMKYFEQHFDELECVYKDSNSLDEILRDGKIILQYQNMQNESRCNNSAFEREFEGLKAICLVGVIGSQSFQVAWDTGKYDIMIAASYTKDRWTVSLYTEKPEIDVSVICKKYGGGGHKGAAGFVTQDIHSILRV